MRKIFITGAVIALCVIITGCKRDVQGEKIKLTIDGLSITAEYTGTLENGKPVNGKVKNCPMTVVIADQKYEGYYTGDVVNEQITGTGDFSSSDGDVEISYTGMWEDATPVDKINVSNFPYCLTITDREYDGIYDGPLKDSMPDGTGTFKYDKDDISVTYEGGWSEGELSGSGKLTDSAFYVKFDDLEEAVPGMFEGDTENGHPTFGSYERVNSEGDKYTYTGEWKDDIWNGKGKRVWENNKFSSSIGTFENGNFIPTLSECIQSIGTWKDMSFALSDENKAFIDANLNLFPVSGDEDITKFIAPDLEYKVFIKSNSRYPGQLMQIKNQHILQIWEEDGYSSFSKDGVLTRMIVLNNSYDNVLYVYYPGKIDEAFEGTKIDLIGLPLDTSSYENSGGGTTNCVIMLASKIIIK